MGVGRWALRNPRVRRGQANVRSLLLTLSVTFLILCLAAGTGLFFHRMFPPELVEKAANPVSGYDSAEMLSAVSHTNVQQEMEQILELGSRFMGQPGVYKLEQLIRERYTAAGLEVVEQESSCAVPRALRREILSATGQPLPGVEVYPFMPNNLQPMNTPADGVSGTLVVIDDAALESRKSFSECIGLIDARDDRVPKQLGFLWTRYAKLGLKALIVAHPDGLEQMAWERIAGGESGMVSAMPVNYVRLAATAGIFNHVGETVRLHVRTEFADTRHTTLVGILRAPQGDGQSALVLSCDYDACSVLPDLAPGGMQALGPAAHLAALKGLLPYRDQLRRDVVFISFGGQSMNHDGKYNLVRALGGNSKAKTSNKNPVLMALGLDETSDQDSEIASPMKKYIESQARENDVSLTKLASIKPVLAAEGLFVSADQTREALAAMNDEARTFFDEQILYVLNALILESSEPALQTKIAFEKRKDGSVESAEFKTYQKAKKKYEQAMSAAGLSLSQIVTLKQDYLNEYNVVERWHARFEELARYHELKEKQFAQDLALIDLLAPYRESVFVHPLLAPRAHSDASAAEELTFLAGAEEDTQPKSFNALYIWALQKAKFGEQHIKVLPYQNYHERDNAPQVRGAPAQFIYVMGGTAGFSFYAPISRNRGASYLKYAYPVVLPFMTNTESLRHSLHLTGEVMLTLAMGTGTGKFEGRSPREGIDSANVNFGGKVLVSNVGQSMVPNFPLSRALVSGARSPRLPLQPGFCEHPFYFADPYGNYDVPYHLFWFAAGVGYSPLAVGYGDDGVINFMKDEGASGQRLFKSTGISTWVVDIIRNVTIVTFRAVPVTVLDLLNPQTMREYTGVEFIDKHGLAAMDKTCRFPVSGVSTEGIQTTFVAPEERFFIKLLSGTADNEFANETRAFMLNIGDDFEPDPDREIDGEGYLAQENSLIYRVPFDTARSMSFLNGKRLDLQKRHHMSDERTEAYHEKSLALTAESESGTLPLAEAARKSRESITYSTLNHPVLRESIFEAVLGILWYLGLLVPFVFFFEKLVFGFADIRKQLAAQALTFVIVFALLNILHPAFAMVRSSLMILLGFVIMIISGGVTLMSSGKFHENLEDLRKKSGKVKAADINAMSAVGSAFMLGLNNMHRRKLRTGLTCATLVLMTFVMICFTSVQSDLVDKQVTLGKAAYQGFLVKKERFRGMTLGEVYALNQEYAHTYDVCPRSFLIGNMDHESVYDNPSIEAVYETNQGVTKRVELKSILSFTDGDPIQNALRFQGRKAWFTKVDCLPSEAPPPVIISDASAEELGISQGAVDAGLAEVVVQSSTHKVIAIFESESLARLQDLDGQDLLPFDIDALESVTVDQTAWQVLADKDAPRIPAGDVIIFPDGRIPEACEGQYSRRIIASIAVALGKLPYKEAKERIDAYMERSARSVYYGLDGKAYLGKRTRETSLAGLIDMIIPLIIAALVVLNTIKGSVYERRDEIYVYNAVGIAPRYVFFMFFAEAIVYAVVGAVMGYLMSQGVGRILTEIGMTGGMNMTFTSLTTIYASLAIAAATFISTYFPARTAMEIATPAEDAGWDLPEPDGDVLSFDLPFTFTHHDHIAVLSFFNRYLQDHGEGSSGRFFASPPGVGVGDERDELSGGKLIPQVNTTIWLKPYDLSVSQGMLITMPTDSETNEFIAHIKLTRLSGTKESWMRLNKGFVAQVRKHFLHWRAVSDEDRTEMFEEAKELMEAGVLMDGKISRPTEEDAES